MTGTGKVCNVDPLGRIKIPSMVADLLKWSEKDTICITLKNDSILLTKAELVCMFCGGTKDVANILGKSICKECANTIKEEQPLTDTVISGHKRKLDELRRIVLPVEMRNLLDVKENEAVELFIEDSTLIVKKYGPACIFCKEAEGLHKYKGRDVCKRCSSQINAIFYQAPQILMEERTEEEQDENPEPYHKLNPEERLVLELAEVSISTARAEEPNEEENENTPHA